MKVGIEKEFFEDCVLGEVTRSQGRTISEYDIYQYAGLTGDWHPLHTDVEFASNSRFGERIAHGFLVLSLGVGLGVRIPNVLPKRFVAAYGVDNVRFTAPSHIGDTIHTEIEVIDLQAKSDDLGLVSTKTNIRNQHGTVVCSYQSKMAVERRPQAAN